MGSGSVWILQVDDQGRRWPDSTQGIAWISLDSSRGELSRAYFRRMVLAFRYRLLPTKAQHRALEQILESQRELYNAALQERIGAYRNAGRTITYFDQSKSLTELREADAEFSSLPVSLQRATLKRLDQAYQGFFRRLRAGANPGFPRFRGKGWFDSFGFRQFQGIALDNQRLRFKGMPGGLRIHWHRELPGSSIKGCTFKREGNGWCAAFAVEITPSAPRTSRRAVGVDLGISTFAALSDGGCIPSLRAARKAERRLRLLRRAFSRKKRGSNGKRKARALVARCHAMIARRRREYLHQATARMVRDYDDIVVEKLRINGLARSVLAKDVHDASWAKFLSMLRYKAEWAGARIIEVNPRYTSQECSGCGVLVPKGLAMRHHDCPICGLSIDRDLNAARNILIRAGVGPGLPNVSDGGMRAGENLRWNYAAIESACVRN
jgi:putative transposase